MKHLLLVAVFLLAAAGAAEAQTATATVPTPTPTPTTTPTATPTRAEIAINPIGTDAVAFGKLRLDGSSSRACMNVTILSSDPPSPADGDVWFVDDGASRQQGCIYSGGILCWDAVSTP